MSQTLCKKVGWPGLDGNRQKSPLKKVFENKVLKFDTKKDP